MIKKINRKECLERYLSFPTANYFKEEFFYPESVDSYILTLNSKSPKGHIKNLIKEFVKLLEILSLEELIFLGDFPTPWLYQQNSYKPVNDALVYLVNNKVTKRFNGALAVDRAELPTFFKHLFWLSRCNASLPYFHFLDPKQSLLGSICKYGNIHLSTLNEETNAFIEVFLKQSDFIQLEHQQCSNQFSKLSAIAGRQIII